MTLTLETPIVEIAAAPKRFYTVAEFFALPDDGHNYELVKGELVEKDRTIDNMPGPSIQHGEIIITLGAYIKEHLRNHPVGKISTNAAFVLKIGEDSFVRRPDLGFLALTGAMNADASQLTPGPPDLAIEVISTTDIWSEIVAKVREYQAAGTKLVWVVDSFGSGVFVYRQNQITADLVGLDRELDGGDVIEGFRLAVGRIFE